MIQVRDLTKRFGSLTAVDRISFQVQEGESVALWGPNGAGKTTVLHCLLGLLPFEGEVRIAGHDVRTQGRSARRLMGFVPQALNFHDDMSVEETLLFYARLKQVPGRAAEVAAATLDRLALAEHAHKLVRELSGGMKQRLALAVALLSDPPLIVLDEPTANLDAQAREALLALLTELKAMGKTLVFSSHRLEEVAALADRVLVMQQGRLVVACPPGELSAQLGWKTVLRLYVPVDQMAPALALLSERGFVTHRNERALHVQVSPQAKGEPIGLLAQAGISVYDFEIDQGQEVA